jgi:LysR family transcriptional regulator, hydrogen peroxide-inducible genes activator
MEMQQIRYFLALADKLNFTRAAELCNVTQPSLTRAIKLLEGELGGPLIRRERANTHLTELGRIVRSHLEQVYDEAQKTKRAAKELTRPKKTTLKLGVMCTIAPDQIIELIGSMQAGHPKVELRLSDANASDLEKQLLEGLLDVAIYCIPGCKPEERTHAMSLFRERMVVAIHRQHRLANGATIRVKDLDGECYIHRTNCEFAGYADPVFDAQNTTCEAVYWSDRDDWTLAMVAAGVGWAFMPENSVGHAGVVGIPFVEPEFWREVNFVSVRGRPYSAACGALVREAMRMRWFGQTAIAVDRGRSGSATDHRLLP